MKTITLASLSGIFVAATLCQGQTRTIYPNASVAPDEISAAIKLASKQHKKVILDFGGNWCGDCRALDHYFHSAPNATLLDTNFVLVDVNIGHFDQNVDIAKKYGVPLNKGVPALAVLDSKGTVLFSQKKGEFESMGSMQASSVTDFLKHWLRS